MGMRFDMKSFLSRVQEIEIKETKKTVRAEKRISQVGLAVVFYEEK